MIGVARWGERAHAPANVWAGYATACHYGIDGIDGIGLHTFFRQFIRL